MRGDHRPKPLRALGLLAVFVALVVVVVARLPGDGPVAATGTAPSPRGPSGAGERRPPAGPVGAGLAGASLFPSRPGGPLLPGPNLAPGSDPSVLPGDLLIADEGNDRLLVVDPSGAVVWQFPPAANRAAAQSLPAPDDGFFTPDGRSILATEETYQVVSLVDVRQMKIIWRYGTPGTAGARAGQLSNPDDAMMLPDGDVFLADIKNCNLLLIAPMGHTPLEQIGAQDSWCAHQPPYRFGSPNGAFPLRDGNWLVTEINGDWADEVTLAGRVLWSTHPPGVAYPSDTSEVRPGVYITADYSDPGQVVEFDRYGHTLWRYGPTTGPGSLDQPSLCEVIPTNGYVLCNDDGNDRVIVLDPRTSKIVWQYGHKSVPGSAPGYLSEPDGVDLAPPYSLLLEHAATIKAPGLSCDPALPAGSCTVFNGP